jgi:hypothetical protein
MKNFASALVALSLVAVASAEGPDIGPGGFETTT